MPQLTSICLNCAKDAEGGCNHFLFVPPPNSIRNLLPSLQLHGHLHHHPDDASANSSLGTKPGQLHGFCKLCYRHAGHDHPFTHCPCASLYCDSIALELTLFATRPLACTTYNTYPLFGSFYEKKKSCTPLGPLQETPVFTLDVVLCVCYRTI